MLITTDRVIVLADADDSSIDEKKKEICRYIDTSNMDNVRVVMCDHEIEEWICYSEGFPIRGKPSEILRHKLRGGYEKSHLPDYAKTLDCKVLEKCQSFKRLLSAMDLE